MAWTCDGSGRTSGVKVKSLYASARILSRCAWRRLSRSCESASRCMRGGRRDRARSFSASACMRSARPASSSCIASHFGIRTSAGIGFALSTLAAWRTASASSAAARFSASTEARKASSFARSSILGGRRALATSRLASAFIRAFRSRSISCISSHFLALTASGIGLATYVRGSTASCSVSARGTRLSDGAEPERPRLALAELGRLPTAASADARRCRSARTLIGERALAGGRIRPTEAERERSCLVEIGADGKRAVDGRVGEGSGRSGGGARGTTGPMCSKSALVGVGSPARGRAGARAGLPRIRELGAVCALSPKCCGGTSVDVGASVARPEAEVIGASAAGSKGLSKLGRVGRPLATPADAEVEGA
eukprot:scaffold219495_cov30-Tisochrysis_lutea.AAC.1